MVCEVNLGAQIFPVYSPLNIKVKDVHEKKYHSHAKKFTFLRRFDCKNTVSGISRNLIDKLVYK